MVPGDGLLQRLVEPRPALMILADGLVVVPQRDAGPGRQLLDGLDEVEMLHLPDEGDDVAFGATPEAVVEAQFRVEGEGWGPLGVKRAQADPAGPDPTEGQVLGRHRHEVGGGPGPGDVLVDYPHVPTLRRNPAGLGGVFVIGLRPDLNFADLVSV